MIATRITTRPHVCIGNICIRDLWFAPPSVTDLDGVARQMQHELETAGRTTSHAILFAFDSAELADASKAVIDGVAAFLRAHPLVKVEIDGHTDSIGGRQANRELSRRRAESVKAYLAGNGQIAADRLVTRGYGDERPTASNATPEGRARNRRVVFSEIK